MVSLITKRNQKFKTALYVAVEKGYNEIVEQLLESVNNWEDGIEKLVLSTIYRTIQDENDPNVNKLLKIFKMKNYFSSFIDNFDQELIVLKTFIHKTLDPGDSVLELQSLIERVSNINIQYYLVNAIYDDLTLLQNSVEWFKTENAMWLVKKGADFNVKDINGITVLHRAISFIELFK